MYPARIEALETRDPVLEILREKGFDAYSWPGNDFISYCICVVYCIKHDMLVLARHNMLVITQHKMIVLERHNKLVTARKLERFYGGTERKTG
jgi:hypothetical protein